jgi:HAD superfamily hydrolase (TIGR01509 family)
MGEGNADRVTLSQLDWHAVLFDLDGVLTDTAKVHAAAWQALFETAVRRWAAAHSKAFCPFDRLTDYLAFVDGRHREDGVRGFFASRGITLPEGSASDPDAAMSIAAIARGKQTLFEAVLRRDGVVPIPGAEMLLRNLQRLQMPVAVVSASRNCTEVLAAAGLEGLADLQVDGIIAAELSLPGKPAPDTFLEAARRLAAVPARCVVVEDALAAAAGAPDQHGRTVGQHARACPGHPHRPPQRFLRRQRRPARRWRCHGVLSSAIDRYDGCRRVWHAVVPRACHQFSQTMAAAR